MLNFPALIIGNQAIEKYMKDFDEFNDRLYECKNIKQIRDMIEELIHLNSYPGNIYIYLIEPITSHYMALLKFMEESTLKLVILTQVDSAPENLLSRCLHFEKDVEVRFKNPLESLKVSKPVRNKLYKLFDFKDRRIEL